MKEEFERCEQERSPVMKNYMPDENDTFANLEGKYKMLNDLEGVIENMILSKQRKMEELKRSTKEAKMRGAIGRDSSD